MGRCAGRRADVVVGILPRDGRGVTFRELAARTEETFNMAASFSCFVPYHAATGLARDYRTGTFDLADLNAHNCIEHDASLCRASSLPPLHLLLFCTLPFFLELPFTCVGADG